MTPPSAIVVSSPTGPAWQFLVLFTVVIVGPPLVARARLSGIIGLLVGGYVIGSHGLNLIGAGDTTIPDLGQVGLLYLMFVAGVELDLALLRIHRRAVIGFGLVTFAVPMGLGSLVGFSMSWGAPAALLLGSLLASHTLLVYPAVRSAGLATHRAAATAVGATVLTDTASLVVLAAVSGSQLQGGSAVSIAIQVLVGLVVLIGFSLVLLPRLVRFAFRQLGTDRVVRYLLAVASFLGAATLASSFGIEGIVGAFFAGLGLNRLVPNEGPLMERIDFFGAAVFVPVFMVSVGMLLDPRVMVQGQTLKLAGLFIAASIGGKALAAALTRRPLHLSGGESILMLGLTVPQAAATLAATIVGFDIGLFDQSVVNAVLVLILVSIITATVLTGRAIRTVPASVNRRQALGRRILVALQEPDQARVAFAIAARIAAPDSGVARGLLSCSPADTRAREPSLAELSRAGYAVGLDVDPGLLVHRGLAEGVVLAVAAQDPSLVIVGQRQAADPALGSAGEAVAASVTAPVAIVIGEADRVGEVLLIETPSASDGRGDESARLAAELARRLGGNAVKRVPAAEFPAPEELAPGQVCVAASSSEQVLAASDPAPGAVLVIALAPGPGPGSRRLEDDPARSGAEA